MHLIQIYVKSCPGFISKAASIGGTGVHVFFLCSGFGLYMSYMRSPTNYMAFLKRRFGKVYIPYIIIVAVSAVIPFMYDGDHLQALLSHVFLYKMFIPQYEGSFGVQFWFVSTLFQFYLLFIPLCNLKKRIGNRMFCSIAIAASICWWLIVAFMGMESERVWNSFFLQYLWEFAIGMVIAEKLENGAIIRLPIWTLLVGTVAGLGTAAAAFMVDGTLRIFNDVPALVGYGFLALIVYCLGSSWIRKIVLSLSEVSYEMYLVHILIFTTLFTVTGATGIVEYLVGAVALLAVAAVSCLYHWCIERLMKRKYMGSFMY